MIKNIYLESEKSSVKLKLLFNKLIKINSTRKILQKVRENKRVLYYLYKSMQCKKKLKEQTHKHFCKKYITLIETKQ